MSFKVEQTYTDNPYADVIVYNTKLLGIDTVLKMKDVADANETATSLRNAEKYISCMEKTIRWDVIDGISEEALIRTGITGAALIACLNDKENIPQNKRAEALDNERILIIEHYEELNNYYRMLYGLEPVGYPIVYVPADMVPADIAIDTSIPLHDMSSSAIAILDKYGILDELIAEDPSNRSFIRYLDKKINPYMARKAGPFYPIYVPTIDSTELSDEYKDRLEVNRRYAIQSLYSEAYKYDSDYYDNFIAVFIILNTMVDLISRIQEFITRKEIFDIRTIRYIFESYGVPYYAKIPYRYQVRLVKNLHQLIKYKSTAKCMIDICSLFGFENIKIFKYYLLRNRVHDPEGNYSFTGRDDKDFELKFVKIPIDEPMYEYMSNPQYMLSYEDVVNGDPSWDGDKEHTRVKRDILAKEFNYVRTKYFSIDALYDLAKIAVDQAYFFNMLYDDVELEDLVYVNVPMLSPNQLRLDHVFTFLTALTFRYNDMMCPYPNQEWKDIINPDPDRIMRQSDYKTVKWKDLIPTTASGILSVYGFNFKADLSLLAEAFDQYNTIRMDKGMLPYQEFNQIIAGKDALQKFKLPTDQIPTFKQLMLIFQNNLDIRKILIEGMRHADNKRIYDAFKELYDSLMVIELTFTHFVNPDTGDLDRDVDGDATYTMFLKRVCPDAYNKLIEVDLMDDPNDKEQFIDNLIDACVFAMEEYIDTSKNPGIFHGLPAVSADAAKDYIKLLIDFFKSYKVHFLGVNTIYHFDDNFEGWVKLIDEAFLERKFWKDDNVTLIDDIVKQFNWMSIDDRIAIRERIFLDISTWKYLNLFSKMAYRDSQERYTVYDKRDEVILTDLKEYINTFRRDDILSMLDYIVGKKTGMTVSDRINLIDRAFMTRDYVEINPPKGYSIGNVELTGDGTMTISAPGVTPDNVAVFYPDLSVIDVLRDIDTECGDGQITVTWDADYPVPGILRIY